MRGITQALVTERPIELLPVWRPGRARFSTNIGASALTRLPRDILYRTTSSRGGATTDSLRFLLLISRRRFD